MCRSSSLLVYASWGYSHPLREEGCDKGKLINLEYLFETSFHAPGLEPIESIGDKPYKRENADWLKCSYMSLEASATRRAPSLSGLKRRS